MLINIQYDEADVLLRDLINALPEDRQAEFLDRVMKVRGELVHPSLDGYIDFPFSGSRTDQPT